MSDPSRPSLADPAVQRCPFEAYAAMRETGPLYRDPLTGFLVVTRYEDIRAITSNPELFSNQTGLLGGHESEATAEVARIHAEGGWTQTPTLVDNDPPSHARYRALVEEAFRPARIRAIESSIAEVASGLVDRFPSDGSDVELVSAFAVPLPLTVIADQLGVGRHQLADFKRWSDAVMEAADINTVPRRQIELAHEIVALTTFLAGRCEAARANPSDDILSDVANAVIEGRPLERNEMASILLQLLVAGNETTTNAIASAMLRLIDSGLEPRLREDPDLVSPFVEEVLRLEAPLQNLFRQATGDTELGGVPIPKGSILVLSWAAGNRDPRRFENADEIELDRRGRSRQHLTFGYGVHYCVGNTLARADLKIGFRVLLDRLQNFRLADGNDAVEYQPHIIARGPRRLRIRFDASR